MIWPIVPADDEAMLRPDRLPKEGPHLDKKEGHSIEEVDAQFEICLRRSRLAQISASLQRAGAWCLGGAKTIDQYEGDLVQGGRDKY